jgi:hypothetical protein
VHRTEDLSSNTPSLRATIPSPGRRHGDDGATVATAMLIDNRRVLDWAAHATLPKGDGEPLRWSCHLLVRCLLTLNTKGGLELAY